MPATTILLATDLQQSVLIAHDVNQSHPIAHTPYGHRPQGSGLFSLIGFNGQMPDPVTGHYHLGNGYRQYNPVLMRFNSPDSWSPFGRGGINTYSYCSRNPINRRDLNGHSWFSAFINGLNRNLSVVPNTMHPSQRLSTTTINVLSKSLAALGGEQEIARIAQSERMTPVQYFIDHTSVLMPLKSNPRRLTRNSSLNDIDYNINTLIERDIALTDLQAAHNYHFADDAGLFDTLINQTQTLIDANRDFRTAFSSKSPPSYRLLQNPTSKILFPDPNLPVFEKAVGIRGN